MNNNPVSGTQAGPTFTKNNPDFIVLVIIKKGIKRFMVCFKQGINEHCGGTMLGTVFAV